MKKRVPFPSVRMVYGGCNDAGFTRQGQTVSLKGSVMRSGKGLMSKQFLECLGYENYKGFRKGSHDVKEQFLAGPPGLWRKFGMSRREHQMLTLGKVYKMPWPPNCHTMSINCPTTIETDVSTLQIFAREIKVSFPNLSSGC